MDEDARQLRADIKSDLQAFGVQLSNLGSQFTGLQVQFPLTYITRQDLLERLKSITDECDRRDKSNQAYIQRLEALIQRLIFVIIGALLTGGIALLNEVFRFVGHTP